MKKAKKPSPKRTKKPPRPKPKKRPTESRLGKEIEGLLLIALGFLVLVSLAARLAQGPANLLGPYLGVLLSDLMVLIAGPLPSLVAPFIFFTVGWRLFRGNKAPTSVRRIIFFSLLFVELCALLSINIVRIVPEPGMFLGGGGFIGSFIARYVFIPLFGHKVFGPYFVTLFGVFLTLVWGARLKMNHFIEAGRIVFVLLRDVREGLMAHWAPEPPKVEAKEPVSERIPKSRIPSVEDEEIRQQELERHQDEKKRLEEKQQEFIREKEGVAPQIVAGNEEEPQGPGPTETAAEKRQRKKAELEPEPEMPPPPEPETPAESEKEDEKEDAAEEDPIISEPSTKSIPVIAGVEEKKKKNIKYEPYQFPALELLKEPPPLSDSVSNEELMENSKVLEEKLNDFGVQGKILRVATGPIITRYELELAPGIKVSKVQNLSDDLAMAMRALRIRILAPIPGKAAVGIELPNPKPSTIFLREILASDKFPGKKNDLALTIGKTITGEPYVTDLTKMPHLLVAGQTGSGKSVCINCIISSILYNKSPEECRLLLIDPKVVELALYNEIPHLFAPVVTDAREAIKCLKWAVAEMERRYKLLAKIGVRNLAGFNEKIKNKQIKPDTLTEDENQKLPYIIIVVDELADLMMTAANEVEGSIVRIAQLARAVGIHLVVATQRPSANVITGLIKANMPSRIAFQVASKIDSRVIIDQNGAEKLLGRGDMLFIPPGVAEPVRLHGAFVSDSETEAMVEAVKDQNVKADRLEGWGITEEIQLDDGVAPSAPTDSDLFVEAARLVVRHQLGSTSLIQRRLKVGYARAGRLMDELETSSIVGPNNGSKARDVLVDELGLEAILSERSGG